ncbi:MAG: hypothetical protein WDM89_19615 [Rhizomicrobium sp.]
MDDIQKIMADAAEKIRREAYAAGWRDAIAAVTKAALKVPRAISQMANRRMIAGR